MSLRRFRIAVVAVAAISVMVLPGTSAGAPDDPLFPGQWNLARVGAEAAWARTTGTGIRIGVVDTGVDLLHEDLAGKVVAHTSCIGSLGDQARCEGSGQDDSGHGTHVAGIAAAWKGNGKGIAGLAPGAELVVAKVLSSSGAGTVRDVIAGVKWVVDQGAHVVNLSLGDAALIVTSLLGGNSMEEAIEYAWRHGAIPVLAAGNSNLLGLGLEGSAYGDINAIVVGATRPDDRVAVYSTSTGSATWAIVAPGGAGEGNEADDVMSTFWVEGQPDAYTALAGTSMAAPHVSAAVALLLAQGYTPAGAVERLLETADGAVSCGAGSPTCRGRLNVAGATADPPPAADRAASRPRVPPEAVPVGAWRTRISVTPPL